MPIPLIAWAAGVLATAYAAVPDVAKRIAKEELEALMVGDLGEFEAAALKGAFEKMGLDVDPEEGLTAESITAAINAGPLASLGVEMTNIFDRDAVKADMRRVALAYAVESLGFEAKGLSVDQIRDTLKSSLSEMVLDQIANGGGELVDAAADVKEIVAMITAMRANPHRDESGQWIPPDLSNAPGAESNRARQARYRSGRRKHWIARAGV